MDDNENEKLEDIHSEVQGSHAQLGRIDERTRNIEQKINRVTDEVDSNAADINDLEDSVKRNTTVINAVTIGLSGLVVWAADKFARFLP